MRQVVLQDLAAFDQWFSTVEPGGLTAPEQAILTTYLGWKLGVHKK